MNPFLIKDSVWWSVTLRTLMLGKCVNIVETSNTNQVEVRILQKVKVIIPRNDHCIDMRIGSHYYPNMKEIAIDSVKRSIVVFYPGNQLILRRSFTVIGWDEVCCAFRPAGEFELYYNTEDHRKWQAFDTEQYKHLQMPRLSRPVS